MKEIRISKRNIVVAIILAVVLGVGIALIQAIPQPVSEQEAAAAQEDAQASAAAVTALETFFHVDYHNGKDAWLKSVCALSTPSGCQFITSGAQRMWQKYLEAKTVTTATVQPAEKVAGTASEQVWRIQISLSAPLPGSNKMQDVAYVLVVKGEDGWKFDRFLLPQEIEALRQQQNGEPSK